MEGSGNDAFVKFCGNISKGKITLETSGEGRELHSERVWTTLETSGELQSRSLMSLEKSFNPLKPLKAAHSLTWSYKLKNALLFQEVKS